MAIPPRYSPSNPHFFQPLLTGFTNHLNIPTVFFLKHLKGNNEAKTAELSSDASEITWKVKMDGRKLSDGWEDFAVAHDLRVGDIVVFRYEGEFVFHVTALGPSCCEIQYDGYSDDDEEKMGNLKLLHSSTEKVCDTEKVSRKRKSPKREEDSTLDNSCVLVTVTASNLRRDIVYLPKTFAVSNGFMKKFMIVLMSEEGESWTMDLRHEPPYSGRVYMRRGWTSFCVANGRKHGDSLKFKLMRNDETPVLQLFPLNSEDLHKLDSTIDTENVPRKKSRETEADFSPDHSCFLVAVTVSNLKRDIVYLPKTFAVSNGLMNKFQIVLMNEKEQSWRIDLKHEVSRGRFLMRRGWTNFCVANGKKQGDLFKFKLVQNEEIPVLQLFHLNSEDIHKLEPSNDTRQGECFEATEKEFLGVEANRNDTSQRNYLEAIGEECVSTESNCKEKSSSTSQNRFVTLTRTPTSFKTCRLNFPLEFTNANGINTAGKIILLDRDGGRWSTSLLMDNNKRRTMSLGRGWKGFCEVHNVTINESLVLELIWEDAVPVLKFRSKG